MAFFEDLSKKISDAGQGVARSTRNFTEISRLNSAVGEKEKAVAQLFASLGQLYYEGHSRDPEAEGASYIAQINTLKEEIDQCQEEIKRIKGVGKCPVCGADVAPGAAFCSACSAPIPAQPEPPAAEDAPPSAQRLCPACGKAVPAGNRFCNFCGSKLD